MQRHEAEFRQSLLLQSDKETIVKSRRTHAAASALLGLLLFGPMFARGASAQSNTSSAASAVQAAAPWDQRVNPAAVQADAWFDNYRFRDGETLARATPRSARRIAMTRASSTMPSWCCTGPAQTAAHY